jgi:hypothetical protein
MQHMTHTGNNDELKFSLHLTNHEFLIEAVGTEQTSGSHGEESARQACEPA